MRRGHSPSLRLIDLNSLEMMAQSVLPQVGARKQKPPCGGPSNCCRRWVKTVSQATPIMKALRIPPNFEAREATRIGVFYPLKWHSACVTHHQLNQPLITRTRNFSHAGWHWHSRSRTENSSQFMNLFAPNSNYSPSWNSSNKISHECERKIMARFVHQYGLKGPTSNFISQCKIVGGSSPSFLGSRCANRPSTSVK